MIILHTLIALALLLTALSLGVGVFSMAQGGEFDSKHSNHLMLARTISQSAVIVLLILAYVLS